MRFKWKYTCADVATCYITGQDDELLGQAADSVVEAGPNGGLIPRPIVWRTNYGYFVHVPADKDDLHQILEECTLAGFSPAFRKLLAACQRQDIALLRFDSAGGDVTGAETFAW